MFFFFFFPDEQPVHGEGMSFSSSKHAEQQGIQAAVTEAAIPVGKCRAPQQSFLAIKGVLEMSLPWPNEIICIFCHRNQILFFSFCN